MSFMLITIDPNISDELKPSLIRRVSKYVRQLFGRLGRDSSGNNNHTIQSEDKKPRRRTRVYKIFVCSMSRADSEEDVQPSLNGHGANF